MRVCCRCKAEKADEDYYKRGKAKGLMAWCKACHNEACKSRYHGDPTKLTAQKQYYRNLRLATIAAYGGDKPACACCGESHIEFLEIDHINNDGAVHRKEIGSGAAIFLWLKKNNYPVDFQLLCSNCNKARYVYGVCPHQEGR